MSNDINEALLEGESANNWAPGSWANTPTTGEDEWQPDLEPPHINDYAAFKKHKHYGKYFRPYRYTPFPATMYHPTLGKTDVKSKEEVIELGPEWSRFVPIWFHQIKGQKVIKTQDELEALGSGWTPCEFDQETKRWAARRDMTGKSHPVKSETTRLAEVVAQGLAKQGASGSIDATTIASIVAAVMAATQQGKVVDAPEAAKVEPDAATDLSRGENEIERRAMIELAEKDGVKIDKRWSNARIKTELGL